jgi:D-glycero-D-manno-heptose 1,7-bisphosphate phosphatase
MILKAQQRYGLDLTDTIMIGDSAKDILSGRNAGCGNTILVQTGNGPTALEELRSQGIAPDFIAADLLDAARLILSNKR